MKRYPETDRLQQALMDIGRQMRRQPLYEGFCTWGGWALLFLLALFFVDYMTHIPFPVRLLLWLGALAYGVRWFLGRFYRAACEPVDPEGVSLVVESHMPDLQSRLISTLQFQTVPALPQGMSADLVDAAVLQTFEQTRSLDLNGVIDRGWIRRETPRLGAAFGVWLLLLLLAPGYVASFAQRLILPSAQYPTRTQILALHLPERLAEGDSFVVRVEAGGHIPEMGKLLIEPDTGPETELDLLPASDDPTVFSAVVPPALGSFHLSLQLGDAERGPIAMTPLQRPFIKTIQTQIRPPEYVLALKRPDLQERTEETGTVRVVEGSRLALRVEPTKPLTSLRMLPADERKTPPTLTRGADGIWTAEFQAEQSFAYSLEMIDQDGLQASDMPRYHITVSQDRPPTIRLIRPTGTVEMAPMSKMPFAFDVKDDFLLTSFAIKYVVMSTADFDALDEQGGYDRLLDQGKVYLEMKQVDRDAVSFEGLWENMKVRVLPGQLVRVWVEATDNSPARQVARSPELQIRVITEDAYRAILLQRLGERMERADELILDIKEGRRTIEDILKIVQ